MVEKLKAQFENYENSAMFIDCVMYAFHKSSQREKKAQWFINNHFKQYDQCDIIMMKKCAAHWNNISYDKLNQYDFINYKHSLHTLANYRMLIKAMELLTETMEP